MENWSETIFYSESFESSPPPSATQNNQKQSSPADNLDPFANSEPMNIEDDQLPF